MLAMDPRQAELSRAIDPGVLGRRIRNARLAAGVRQAAVAEAAGVTTAYVSRIEAGERRPAGTKLEAIARLLNVPVEWLIAPDEPAPLDPAIRFKLDQAQLAYSAGSVEEAVSVARDVLGSLGDGPADIDARWQADLVLALCHEALGDLDRAIVELERVAAEPRPDATWIKVLIALSRCCREVGDTARAISVGEDGLRLADELGILQLPEAIQLALTVAAAYAEQGEIDRAARICRRASDEATEVGSPVAQASAYWNGSIMEARRGRRESAAMLASKAVALYEMDADLRNLGRLRTDLALMQISLVPPQIESAWENLEKARREFEWSSASPSDHGRNRLVAARVLAAQGEVTEALEMLNEVLAIDPSSSPMLIAEAQVARGQWLAELGQTEAAVGCYRQAVVTASVAGANRAAAQFWFDLAELLDSIGDHDAARDAYRRSAASAGMASRQALPAHR